MVNGGISREWGCGDAKSDFYANYQNDLVVT